MVETYKAHVMPASDSREFRIRSWLAATIIKSAAWISNCRIEVDIVPPSHVRLPNDGGGPIDVYLDGELIKHVLYVDEKRGIVRVAEMPLRIAHKRVVTRTLYGTVSVRPHGQH